MFIYFCGSIRGGRQDAEIYVNLIEKLQGYGTVFTEHVGKTQECDEESRELDDKEIHDRDVKWLEKSDVVVAEVTQPSLGVGYELGRAIAMDKKVLCLYRPSSERKLSCMIRGATNGDKFIVRDYKVSEADEIFTEFLGDKEQQNGNKAADGQVEEATKGKKVDDGTGDQ